MQWWQAVILGLVEGITEYLPISSTGHLILASGLMGLDDPSAKRSVDAFAIVIQGGAILAVLGLYWPSVRRMLLGLIGRDDGGRRLLVSLLIAFAPAAVLGVLLDDWIGRYLFRAGPVLAALALGGVFMLWVERWRQRRLHEEGEDGGQALTELRPGQALTVGLLQCVAMWPGTSRSMMTITGGVLVGLSPRRAAEFSFLLGLPTLGGATVYRLVQNLLHARRTGDADLFADLGITPVILGVLVATISAAAAIRWLVAFLNRHGLAAFGWYRLVLCAVLGSLILSGVVSIGAATADAETAREASMAVPGMTGGVEMIP